jgi:3-deoxy-7-phosphoheptulonate synthase
MIIMMNPDAKTKDIEYVTRRAESLGLRVHISRQDNRTLIGLHGELGSLDMNAFSGLRGVEKIQPLSRPFRLASREFKQSDTLIRIRDCEFGGPEVVTIAGPCSVEGRDQILRTAEAVKEAGGRMLRGGAFKPRSSPYSWQGLGDEGLRLLDEARSATGLAIVTEVMTSEQVPLVSEYADVLQIGTRNMQNFPLLRAAGETGKPILLKRGMMSTIEEFLLSAEYILACGNPNVILCERGIRTFETYTRNTLDINAVPVLKELSHLPVVVDPSHATGRSSLVKAVSRAAVAAGADGLIIEVHVDPQKAWSDGFQTISPQQFQELMGEVGAVARAVGRELNAPV